MKKKIFKSILFLLLFQGFFAWSGFTQDTQSEYDPMYTVHALNACVFSISNILRFEDRIVLDEEYKNIINNLKLGNISPDDELRSLYRELMDYITEKKLNEMEQARVKAIFERTSKRAAWEAVGGIRAYGANPISFFLSFVQSAGSAYFQYHNLKSQMQQELDESLWQLERADITELNRLRKELLNTAWVLHGKYKFPDQYRLTEELINNYFDAIYDSDLARAQRKLSRLESHFDNFPPFWYHFGRIAQQNNKNDFALQCYDKFEKSYREIYRKDPLYAQLCLNKLHILGVADGLKNNLSGFSNFDESKPYFLDKSYILNILKTAENHSRFEEGYNYLRMAIFYQAIGEISEAQRCIQINIDNNVELDISNIAFTNLKNNKNIFVNIPELLYLFINKNDYSIIDDKEVESVKNMANAGSAIAQYHYARYLDSKKRNSEEALVYYLKAADQGHAPSMLSVVMHPSTPLDDSKSIAYLKNSADLMYPPSLFMLGLYYLYNIIIENNDFLYGINNNYLELKTDLDLWELKKVLELKKDLLELKKGLELFESAAKMEIPDAHFFLFLYYKFIENSEQGDKWFISMLQYAETDKWLIIPGQFLVAVLLKYFPKFAETAKISIKNCPRFDSKELAKKIFDRFLSGTSKNIYLPWDNIDVRLKMKAYIEKFFIDHNGESIFQLNPHINNQKMKNAIASYATNDVKLDNILLLYDATLISGNADMGFFITSNALYSNYIGRNGIPFDKINMIEIKTKESWFSTLYYIYINNEKYCMVPSGISPDDFITLIEDLKHIYMSGN